MMRSVRIVAAAAIGGTLLWSASSWADDPNSPQSPAAPAQTAAQDPPARVGRLAYIEGQALQFGAGKDDWVPAQLNFPVTSNTAFATGPDGRAELDLSAATTRLDFGTELDIVTLDGANVALRLPQGSASVEVPAPADGAAPVATMVTTPRGDVTLAAPGHYFLSAGTNDQPTTVTVVDGQAQIADAANATFNVAAGQSGTLTGDSTHPSFGIAQPESGPFVAWVQQRGATAAAAPPPPPEVSPQMTGVDVLSAYGDWRKERKYGSVWFPRDVKADWKPYRDGHWVNIQPWGWTWIDNEPWGFAPFHYGRWVRIGSRWAWAPGSRKPRHHAAPPAPPPAPTQAQNEAVTILPPPQPVATLPPPEPDTPVYAPALVAFGNVDGNGPAPGNQGGNDPSVAWYPLGWNEPYVPSYPVSRVYMQEVNDPVVDRPRLVELGRDYDRIVDPDSNYDPYQRFDVGANRSGIVAIPRSDFQNAIPVPQAAITINVTVIKPAPRPLNVPIVPIAPTPVVVVVQPPQPKILPPTQRVAIPPQLLKPQPTPTAAINPPHGPAPTQGKPPVQPVVAHPPTGPQPIPTTPTAIQPTVVHPGAKPVPPPHPTPLTPALVPSGPKPGQPPHPPIAGKPPGKPPVAQPPTTPIKPAVIHPTPISPKPPIATPTTPSVVHPTPTPPKPPVATPAVVHPVPTTPKPTMVTPMKPAVVHPAPTTPPKPNATTQVKPAVIHPEPKAAPKPTPVTPAKPAVVHSEAKPAPKPTVVTPAKPAVVHPEPKPQTKTAPTHPAKPATASPANAPKHVEPHHDAKTSPTPAGTQPHPKPKPAPDEQH